MKNNIYRQAKYQLSAHTLAQFPADLGKEVAFAGRSNAGKSSVINAITDRKRLARISKTPGRTRQINFFLLDKQLRFVDLPGYGFARVSNSLQEHWAKILNSYFVQRKSLKGLILIIDIRRNLTDYDRQMLNWCQAATLPVHILLNKSDKLSRGAGKQALLQLKQQTEGFDFTIQLFSVLKKTGVAEVRTQLDRWLIC